MRGARRCTARRSLRQRRGARARDRRLARRGGDGSRPRRAEGGRDEPRGDPGRDARGERRDDVRRRGRVDAHVLAREDVDRRARGAAEAAAAPAHAVQPRSAVGGDRHGLHEPEPVGARRPRVRVHRDAAAAAPEDGRRALADPQVVGARRRVGARGVRLARGADARVARFGDNMREVAVTEGDKVEAQIRLGRLGERLRRRRPRARRSPALRRRRSTDSSRRTRRRTTLAPALAPGRRAPRVAARRRPDRGRAARASSTRAGSTRSPTRSRISTASPQLPGIAVQRLMADGYGFGAEGDWKTAALVRDREGDEQRPRRRHLLHGGLHLRPRSGRPAQVLGAHMLEVCPSIAAERPSCEIHPLSIGGKADPVRLVFTAAPGPAVLVGAARSRRPLPARR